MINQLTGFYMRATLVLDRLTLEAKSVDDPLSKPWFHNDNLRQLVIKNKIAS